MPRKGASEFVEGLQEEQLQEEQQEFQETNNFYKSNIHQDQVARAEFEEEKSFMDKTGDFFMNVLSLPDRLDKAVGIYGTRQKAIKALTGGLSEKHILASLAGEMLVPDTIDIATLGLGYIPRRVLLKGPKFVKAFLKSRASRLPKFARKTDEVVMEGSRYADDADIGKMIAQATEEAKLEKLEAEKVLKAKGARNITDADINTELGQTGKRQFIDPEDEFVDAADLELRKAKIDANYDSKSQFMQMKKYARDEILSEFIVKNPGGAYYFDYNIFRQAVSDSRKRPKGRDGREWLELFQTPFTSPYTQIPTATGRPFFNNFELAEFNRMFKPAAELLDLTGKRTVGRMDFSNVHHYAALKGIMGIYDKLGFNSPMMHKINEKFRKAGIGTGAQEANYGRLVGGTADKDSPHFLAHAFFNDVIGPSGEKFFTADVLAKMNASDAYRLQKADELVQMVVDSKRVALKAQEVYERVADAALAVDYADVQKTLARLQDKGLLKMAQVDSKKYNVIVGQNMKAGKYRTKNFDKLIEDIVDVHKYRKDMPDLDMDKILFDETQLGELKRFGKLLEKIEVRFKNEDVSSAKLRKIIQDNGIRLMGQQGLFSDLPDMVANSQIEAIFKKIRSQRKRRNYFRRKTTDAKYAADSDLKVNNTRQDGQFIDTGELDEFGNPKL